MWSTAAPWRRQLAKMGAWSQIICLMGFLHSISITDNEELKHNSLMHEKKGLHRAGYSQAMIILMKLTLIQEAQEEA